MHRRAFLQFATLTGSMLAWPTTASAADTAEVDPAAVLTSQLGDLLHGPTQAGEATPISALTEALAVAQREFGSCRYLPLASRLPALITSAEATAATRTNPAACRVLAESYHLATRALIKLAPTGLERLSADRALQSAHRAENPLTLSEAQRLVASVARRAGQHGRAQQLTLEAATNLDLTGPRPAPEHLAMHGKLHLSAAYAAARAGDRNRAHDLLAEAETTLPRLTDAPDRHHDLLTNLVSHKVSVAYILGDTSTALAHAHSLPLATIPTTERRARLLVDTAQAWAQWDRPDRAYATLLAAEHTAPGEVRTRNAVRRLVTQLLAAPKQAAMPDLPALARRIHAVA